MESKSITKSFWNDWPYLFREASQSGNRSDGKTIQEEEDGTRINRKTESDLPLRNVWMGIWTGLSLETRAKHFIYAGMMMDCVY